jgi:hypothetical protein
MPEPNVVTELKQVVVSPEVVQVLVKPEVKQIVVAQTGTKGDKGDKGDPGISPRFEKYFTATDLNSSGFLIVVHALNLIPDSGRILTPSGDEILVQITTGNTTTAAIDMQDFTPLIGTYLLILGG